MIQCSIFLVGFESCVQVIYSAQLHLVARDWKLKNRAIVFHSRTRYMTKARCFPVCIHYTYVYFITAWIKWIDKCTALRKGRSAKRGWRTAPETRTNGSTGPHFVSESFPFSDASSLASFRYGARVSIYSSGPFSY